MFTAEQLAALKQADTCDLVDIKSVAIDAALPVDRRLDEFIRQIKNPYMFLCGKTKVTIEYNADGKPLDELLANYLSRQTV